MYCGNCLRDNALVTTLRQMGHEVTMVPLYLPLTLDEPDQSADTPIFFSGINVYLEQKSALFRGTPGWFRKLLGSRKLLKWASGRAAKTRAQDVGEITLSMLRGEDGNQARDLDELIAWLKAQATPDVVCLSNVLLIGMARHLKQELNTAVVCMLQGEDWFLDALPESYRADSWKTVAERAREVDMLIAPSHYFGDLMSKRLNLPAGNVQVSWNGIHLAGFEQNSEPKSGPPAIGYFARLCAEKGMDTLVDAYLLLRKDPRNSRIRLRLGGSCGPADEPFVQAQLQKLKAAGVANEVEVHPNLSRDQKIAFLKSLSMFSVPAKYGEAFGLYVVEAMAVGVPVVQPRAASYPELIEASGGGVLCEPNDPRSLAKELQGLLDAPEKSGALGASGRKAAVEKFSSEAMARSILAKYQEATRRSARG